MATQSSELDILKHYSLAEIESLYRYGSITPEQLALYLAHWNNTPGRFTRAEWKDGAIRQTLKP